MSWRGGLVRVPAVALRKESVDRNMTAYASNAVPDVALRKESVDRNTSLSMDANAIKRRSPQGERG